MKYIKKFFENKYQGQTDVTEKDCHDFLTNIKLPCLTKEQALHCGDPISISETVNALKSMQNGKSPGNDGLPKEFYPHFF